MKYFILGLLFFNEFALANNLFPVVSQSPTGYVYKNIKPGESIYSDQSKTEGLILDNVSPGLGFQYEKGIRIIQTRQADGKSDPNRVLVKLSSDFTPNLMVAYDLGADGNGTVPTWLRDKFIQTDEMIVTRYSNSSKSGAVFQVFEYVGEDNPKRGDQQTVVLGGNGSARNMYMILVRTGHTPSMSAR